MSASSHYMKPPHRRLRGFAFDPSLSLKMDTVDINQVTYKVPWEELETGPIGEYIEVVDYDPTIEKFYSPVNLNDPNILAQDGHNPSESNPQFHQQMVYAVAMTTIKNFESALGRKILWSPRLLKVVEGGKYEEYVQRLRIYPHALRDKNAYYSPQKKSLLFGYFSATPADKTVHMPGSLVFTCLSHDIIAHETTHAILDGMHGYYNEATNPDVLAFHEAFADIVALFQHFTFAEVLKHQVAKTRGDLASQNLLGELAQEFGKAVGSYGSLRDAIGEVDPKTKKWKPKEPDANDYVTVKEPHSRGSILVAAVFEAFINIYKTRVAPLLRVASNGTGILPQGDLHPDLVNLLADEAAKSAGQVLKMCIRALDYCPPVDITFGDYLCAIISADVDVVSDDSKNYRLAFIEAFRRRGIYPKGIKTLSVESLTLPLVRTKKIDNNDMVSVICSFLREYGNRVRYINKREELYNLSAMFITGGKDTDGKYVEGLHERLTQKFSGSAEFEKITGLLFSKNGKGFGIRKSLRTGKASFQVLNLRLVNRVGPTGKQVNQVVFSLVQRSYLRNNKNNELTDLPNPVINQEVSDNEIVFLGGCTLIFDLDTKLLKYSVSKPILDADSLAADKPVYKLNMQRAIEQYNYQHNYGPESMSEHSLYFGGKLSQNSYNEHFALLHNH